jgi:hypothetical protein
MFMICLSTAFHMFSSSGSLVVTLKPKGKCRFHAAVILYFTSNFLANDVCSS